MTTSTSRVNYTYKVLEGTSIEDIVSKVNKLPGWKIDNIYHKSTIKADLKADTTADLDTTVEYSYPENAYSAILVKEKIVSRVI